jgi:hypothetical protein
MDTHTTGHTMRGRLGAAPPHGSVLLAACRLLSGHRKGARPRPPRIFAGHNRGSGAPRKSCPPPVPTETCIDRLRFIGAPLLVLLYWYSVIGTRFSRHYPAMRL